MSCSAFRCIVDFGQHRGLSYDELRVQNADCAPWKVAGKFQEKCGEMRLDKLDVR